MGINRKSIMKCKFCSKDCKNRNSLINHERLCKKNPNRQHIEEWVCRGDKWKERLGGKSHPGSNQFIKARRLGLPIPPGAWAGKPGTWSGKTHTEEQKRKISESMKRHFLESGATSIWHTQLEKRKSYAEQYFETIFVDAKRNYHVDRYFLDFAWPDKKIYIEVDGEQHYTDSKVIEHDIERTKRLEECGWNLLKRIRWSHFQSLNDEEKETYISEILTKIQLC